MCRWTDRHRQKKYGELQIILYLFLFPYPIVIILYSRLPKFASVENSKNNSQKHTHSPHTYSHEVYEEEKMQRKQLTIQKRYQRKIKFSAKLKWIFLPALQSINSVSTLFHIAFISSTAFTLYGSIKSNQIKLTEKREKAKEEKKDSITITEMVCVAAERAWVLADFFCAVLVLGKLYYCQIQSIAIRVERFLCVVLQFHE